MAAATQPALIGLDWGTSSLRGYLMAGNGRVLATVAKPWGIQHLPAGGFAAAFRGIAGEWLALRPTLPVVAAGMVGSRQGWQEVPYVECPADAETLARGLVAIATEAGEVHLVPGVIQRGPLPNVMRGEETQLVGAMATDPAVAAGALAVLPGTHSKWVAVRNGGIRHFRTYLTGELFAVLRDHSLLGRPAGEATQQADAAACHAAFARGLAVARESGSEGVAGRLFTARSLFLAGDLAAEATLEYLSGLLVGEEIRSGLAASPGDSLPPILLIGDAALCQRYRDALAAFGIESAQVHGDTAAAGLWRIAEAAGLVAGAAARDSTRPFHG